MRKSKSGTTRASIQLAKARWGQLPRSTLASLKELSEMHRLSIASGDLCYLDGRWYVTHSGLLRLASRRHCRGIEVTALVEFCDPSSSRWAFKATVYKSPRCKGFVGHGDA